MPRALDKTRQDKDRGSARNHASCTWLKESWRGTMPRALREMKICGRIEATTPHPSMLRLIRIAAVLAAARPTLLFRPLLLEGGTTPRLIASVGV